MTPSDPDSVVPDRTASLPPPPEPTATAAGGTVSAPDPRDGEELTPVQLVDVERLCDEYEDRLRSGQSPELGEFLAGVPVPLRPRLFRELVRLEQVYPHPAAPQGVAAYRQRYPEYAHLLDDFTRDGEPAGHPPGGEPGSTHGPQPTPAPGGASPGDQFGPYTLIERVAAGAMGVVYRARQTPLGREVALKMILGGDQVRPDEMIRFLAEAQAVAAIDHPHVVRVHEFGEHAGRPFLAMEFLTGGTLARRIGASAPLEPRAAAELVRKIAAGVAAAHDLGIVHRDLKPGNILFDAAGEPKVTDFGLAKRGVGLDLTKTQAVMGTPSYMAPEQARGGTKFVGPPADVWALGVILYESLTGNRPFTGENVHAILQAVIHSDPPTPRQVTTSVPRDLNLIVGKCLEKEPRDRYPTANELAEDLRRYTTGEPISVRPPGPVEKLARWVRRRPTLAAAVLVFLVVGVAFAWWQDRQATARRERLARNTDAMTDSVGRCEDALHEGDADRAAEALAEIDRRLPEGGGEAVADRTNRCRVDLALFRELDTIDAFMWTPVGSKYPEWKEVAARWRAALAGYGIAPGETPVADAARRVNESLVRDRVLTALDMLLAVDPSPGVLSVLRAADPDPYRNAVRVSVVLSPIDDRVLVMVASHPDARWQPPRFAAMLGLLKSVPVEQRRAVLEASLRSRPDDLALLMSLGRTYPINQREGAEERARWFQAAIAANPRSSAAHNSLGIALIDTGHLDGAIAEFREAIRLAPQYAAPHNNLGRALFAKPDLDGAIAAFRQAVAIDENNPEFHHNLGLALDAAREIDGAIAEFQKAIALDRKYAAAHYSLGAVLRDKPDLEGAIKAFRDAIEADPRFALAYYSLGLALVAKPDLEEASRAFHEAIKYAPNYTPAYYQLGLIYLRQKKYSEAIDCANAALAAEENYANAHGLLGLSLLATDDIPSARKALTRATKLDKRWETTLAKLPPLPEAPPPRPVKRR